jgi:hypothetical protein
MSIFVILKCSQTYVYVITKSSKILKIIRLEQEQVRRNQARKTMVPSTYIDVLFFILFTVNPEIETPSGGCFIREKIVL